MAIHIRSRLRDSALIAPSVAEVRLAARTALEIGVSYGLVLFSIVGDHAHFVVTCSRRDAGQFARAVEAAWTVVSGHRPGFRPAEFHAVFGEGHLQELVGYVLGQHQKHGLVGDPLLEGTNLLDLLHIRLVNPACGVALRTALPELSRNDLYRHVGELDSGTDPGRLVDAAAVVSGGRGLHARSALEKRTREATVRAARRLGLSVPATAELLGLHRSTVWRATTQDDPLADRAIRLALGLVQRLAAEGFPDRIRLADRVWTPGRNNRTRLVRG